LTDCLPSRRVGDRRQQRQGRLHNTRLLSLAADERRQVPGLIAVPAELGVVAALDLDPARVGRQQWA
jgi:hypothetical protein